LKLKPLLTAILVLSFVLSLAASVFAQDMTHSVEYDLNGTISIEKAVGHLCNTGAEMKQVISGDGKLEKASEIYMKAYFLDVMDSNSFVTAPDAVRNMEIITAIELCAPAKHVFTEDITVGFINQAFGLDIQLPPDFVMFKKGDPVPSPIGYFVEWDNELIEALTKQIWATSVSANPGQMGNYTGGFKAAYGPYDWNEDPEGPGWWYVDKEGEVLDLPGEFLLIDSADVGEKFVGNYFGIEQFAYTSSGVTKRFTEISSPFSHAYFTNDLTVTGMASITEAFTMGNLAEGAAATPDWWDLF